VVFFNYTTMQVSAKIVYYGAGLCGKTTNLQHIHGKTDPRSRGEMVSLETEADRTLFFDLLPLEVGTIGGMRVRVQLYTVPGQVFYNTTRKLVLKGVDGIVFVVDSQVPALDANFESLENLKHNLDELNQPLDRIPFVFQFNKRDLRNIHPVEILDRYLNPKGYEAYGAAALHGIGVFETLKAISRKTLAAVHRRISGPLEDKPQVAVPATVRTQRLALSGSIATEPTVEKAAPPGLSTGALNRTDQVKVEFAASLDATPAPPVPGQARSIRRVATRSKLDVERELEKLRRVALGNEPGVARKTAVRATHDPMEVRRELSVKLPRALLEKARHVDLDLRIGDGAGPEHTSPGVVRIELPDRRGGRKTRLQITLDLESDEASG
jgi:hypothetical protein